VTNGALAGGVLSFLGVGCPICNKIVELLLGISGAFTALWLRPGRRVALPV
jgi:hypothetical protein